MLPKKQEKAYTDFYSAAIDNKILGPKITMMIQLATAMAVGCYP